MSSSSAVNFPSDTVATPAWKGILSHVGAVVVAILFLSAGIWHLSSPIVWSRMLEELLVPAQLSLLATLALGISETTAGILILIPRYRRWGAWLSVALLIAFMTYVGLRYSALIGKDCSCFPWVKRSVGPAFFPEDLAMLVAAVIAGWWAKAAASLRGPITVLAVVTVLGLGSYAYAASHLTGTKAPDTITVAGQPFSLQRGSIFLFFYDPHCSHCEQAARDMAKLHWKSDVSIIGIPTNDGRFGDGFLSDTGLKALKAKTSLDLGILTKVFPIPGDPPYGVALDNGREKGAVTHFEGGSEPGDSLRKLGFVE